MAFDPSSAQPVGGFDPTSAQPVDQSGPPQVRDAFPRDAGPPTQAAPSLMDRIQANPVIGAPAQALLRGGQGTEQLLAHAAASASDLGGTAPNSLSKVLRAIADHVDTSIGAQNQGYDGAGARVDAASTNPQASRALRATGETMGNVGNPAGLAGNVIEAAPGVLGALTRGAVSGGAFAASQPVDDPANFWGGKTKQVVEGAATGGATGAAAEALGGSKAAPAPSTQELKSAATDAYKQAEAQGVVIKQDSFKNAVGEIKDAAEKAGIDEGTTPKAVAVLNRFDKEAAKGPLTLEKADTIRKVALGAFDPQNKASNRITHLIVDKLDDYIDGLGPEDLKGGVTGDPQLIKALNLPEGKADEAVAALTEARGLYKRSAKSADIDRIVEKARNAVGANYTAAGMDTALRQKFRAVADNQAAFSRYTPDEQAAILKIVRGGTLQNTLRYIGKLSPTSGLALGAELVGALHEPGIAIPAAIGGYVARQASAKMGQNNVSALSQLVRSGKSNALATPGPAPNGFVWNPLPDLAVNAFMQPRSQ